MYGKDINLDRCYQSVIMLIMIILINLPGILLAQAGQDTVILEKLINEALENNPRLQSFYLASRADSFNIPQSGALPDPMLSLNLLNLPVDNFTFDQEPMTGKQIALKQQFPFPGKLGLKEKISAEKANVSSANYLEFRNQISKDVKLGYYDLYFIDKAVETTVKNQTLLREFVKIAETKYSVGKGLQQDVLRAQVELSRMTDKLITLRQKRLVIQARLNTLLNRPAGSEFGQTAEITYERSEPDLDSLRVRAAAQRPYLSGWQAMRRQSDLRIDLAKKDYWPDLSVFVAYTQRDELQNGSPGVDFLSGGISFDLPVYFWKKQNNQVEESTYNKLAIDQRYSNELNTIYQELENNYNSSVKNTQLIDLYMSGIIPQASQSLESNMIGYQTGKVDFLSLISSQMTLFNYQLEYYQALSDYQKDLAQIEYIVGSKLN